MDRKKLSGHEVARWIKEHTNAKESVYAEHLNQIVIFDKGRNLVRLDITGGIKDVCKKE